MRKTSIAAFLFVMVVVLLFESAESRPRGLVKRYFCAECEKHGRTCYEASRGNWCCGCGHNRFVEKECKFFYPTTTKCSKKSAKHWEVMSNHRHDKVITKQH